MPQAQVPNLKPDVSETTWLEDIAYFEARDMPGGQGKILLYTLRNGHRYALTLSGQTLRLTQQAVSPVTIADASALRSNGHGAT